MNKVNFNISPEVKTHQVHSHGRFTTEQKKRLAKAAQDFEGILISMMLKSMLNESTGLFNKKDFGGDYFSTIFQLKMGEYIAENKGLGLSKEIYEKITGEPFDPKLLPGSIRISGEHPIRSKAGIGSNAVNAVNAKGKKLAPPQKAIERLAKYEDIIRKASAKFGVKDSLLKSIILTESAANPKAVSPAKAKGLMQLMDSTAKALGIRNIFDPEENIFGGARYFSSLLSLFNNNVDLALAAYNAGPEAVKKHNGVPPFKETQSYVNRIKAYLNYFED